MWSHNFVWPCLCGCENPKHPAHYFVNIVLLFILNSLISEWKTRKRDVMFSCDYSSSQQKFRLTNTCTFLWHMWHFQRKIRQRHRHFSNAPTLSLHKEAGKREEMHTFIFFSVTKNVMNIYRALSSTVICNSKCLIPQNNLRERLHST